MENNIQTFTLFIRKDKNPEKQKISEDIAEKIRAFNNDSKKPLKEVENGDLIIAIGGDGTFIHAVTSTNFGKDKIYAGIHTGTLGFLQNLSPTEIFALIKYLSYEKEIKTRKIFIPAITVHLIDGQELNFYALNEILIGGENYSKISFTEYVNGELFQKVSANAICIASSTGDTAFSMNAGGAIDFSNNFQLVRTLDIPIENAVYERFIRNPIICSNFSIVLESSNNTKIIIDGIAKDIPNTISRVDVSMQDDSNYINIFQLETYSKAKIIREKILGY